MPASEEIRRVEAEAECLFSQGEVERAIDCMARDLTRVLAGSNPLVLCVVIGGVILAGRLLLRLPFPLTVDVVHASRYRGNLTGRDVEWIQKPREPLVGRNVLIVDDVLDEGITLDAIFKFCTEEGAESVYSAVLVDKQIKRAKPFQADFVALQADDRYLFGYGMDYKGYLRNSAGIFACKDEHA